MTEIYELYSLAMPHKEKQVSFMYLFLIMYILMKTFYNLIFSAWMYLCSCWPSWLPNWQRLLGAVLLGAWNSARWSNARTWTRRAGWRFLFNVFRWNRGRKACAKKRICWSRALCHWWDPNWNLSPALSSRAADYRYVIWNELLLNEKTKKDFSISNFNSLLNIQEKKMQLITMHEVIIPLARKLSIWC